MVIFRWNLFLAAAFSFFLKQANGDDLQTINELKGPEMNVKITHAKQKLLNWFMKQRKNDTSTDKWGPELPRIATALFLGDESIFEPGNAIGDEIRHELTFQLLPMLSKVQEIDNHELALYIQALTVACLNPKDFYGYNLITKLRGSMKKIKYKDPFEMLSLCIGGHRMGYNEFKNVQRAFDAKYRPFWTDIQAVAVMALQCIHYQGIWILDKNREKRLAEQQFKNGTIDNPITTALLLQALLNDLPTVPNFNLVSAFEVVLHNQKEDGSWGSVRDSCFVLPALNFKSLANINGKHCKKFELKAGENSTEYDNELNEEFVVHYTVLFEENFDEARTWRVMATRNTTFYDVIEAVNELDPKHNVKYNVIKRKPYVSSMYEKSEDAVYGLYWFTYVRPSLRTKEKPLLVKESPADVKVEPNKELILWYKKGEWLGNSPEYAL